MDDEQFDNRLREVAQGYNAPPPAPADAMWAAVVARRAAPTADAAPSAALALHGARGTPGAANRGRRTDQVGRWAALTATAAALVGVGVAIGRHGAPGDAPPAAITASGVPASGARAAAPPNEGERAPATVPRSVGQSAVATAPARPAAVTAPAPPAAPAIAAAGRDASSSARYRATTADHLARVEALLVAFGGAEGDAAALAAGAAPDAAWAADLLATTRLLLDSPAARDPRRRQLFEDLELVLVQIVQLPPADDGGERALIARALQRGDVLTRLRASTPGRAPARGG